MNDRDRAFLERHKKMSDNTPSYDSSKETVEIYGDVRRETAAAILWFDGTKEAWVPKSIGRVNGDGQMLSLPMWAAKDKGFI